MSISTIHTISAIVIIVSVLLIVFFTIQARWRAIRANKRSPEVRERYKLMMLKNKP